MKIIEDFINGILIKNIIHDSDDLCNDQEKKDRINICSECDEYINESCKLCGCIIQTKITYKDSECPINKW